MRLAHYQYSVPGAVGPTSSSNPWTQNSDTATNRQVNLKLYISGGGMEMDYDRVGGAWQQKVARIYIPAPGGRAGAAELKPTATSFAEHKFEAYFYDHLGSIQAVTDLGVGANDWFGKQDATNRYQVYSYDAWGQRRDAWDWFGYASEQAANAPYKFSWGGADDRMSRGFTGHEMLDHLGGLVHMNGRIYDPLIGRFLSADLVIQSPYDLQSYNRYSYVMNNPLRYVDPTGYFWDTLFDAADLVWSAGSTVANAVEMGYHMAKAKSAESRGDYAAASHHYSAAAKAASDGIDDAAGTVIAAGSIAIPGLSSGGVKTLGVAVDGARALENLGDGAKAVDSVSDAAKRTEGLVKNAGDALPNGAAPDTAKLADQAPASGTVADAGKVDPASKGCGCFLEGTLAITADGAKPIEEIQPGDLVWSFNLETGEFELKEVERIFVQEKGDDLVTLVVDGAIIKATGNHPILVLEGEDLESRPQPSELDHSDAGLFGRWVEARDLRPGDKLLLGTGEVYILEATSHRLLDRQLVYNFHVPDNHTYLVSEAGLVVHNTECDVGTGGEKTYQTYTKTNPETGEVYSGRTSGTGTPAENVANRDRNHHMNEEGFGPAQLDQSSTNKDAIRGREQQLIEANGGAKSQGGTSGNAINGISPKNESLKKYLEAAEEEFN